MGWKGMSIGILLGLGVNIFVISQRFFFFRISYRDGMYSIDLLDHDLSVYPKTCEISRKYLTS